MSRHVSDHMTHVRIVTIVKHVTWCLGDNFGVDFELPTLSPVKMFHVRYRYLVMYRTSIPSRITISIDSAKSR
jgi:hypothetical protein